VRNKEDRDARSLGSGTAFPLPRVRTFECRCGERGSPVLVPSSGLGLLEADECIPQCIPTARYEEDVQARLGFSKCLIRNGP